MATFTDLATRALGNDFPTTSLTDAKRWVRTGLSELYVSAGFARGDMVFPVNTSAADSSVTLALSGTRVTAVVDVETGEQLEELSPVDVQSYVNSLTGAAARGRPLVYAITGDMAAEFPEIILAPIPDKVYALHVYGSRAPGAGEMDDADTVPLPERYEDGPVAWARMELFDWLEDDDRSAERWRTKFEDTGRRMRGELQLRSRRNRRVPGTWSRFGAGPPQFRHPQGLF